MDYTLLRITQSNGVPQVRKLGWIHVYDEELKKMAEADIRMTIPAMHNQSFTPKWDTDAHQLQICQGVYTGKDVVKRIGDTVAYVIVPSR